MKGYELYGIRNGWGGLHAGHFMPMDYQMLDSQSAGVAIGTSRWNPNNVEGAMQRMCWHLADKGIHGLIVIGGNDTLETAFTLYNEFRGLPTVGIPKTIDNDLPGCDTSLGFQTAVAVIGRTLMDIRAVANSMERTYLIEVMGRRTGWLAAHGGVGADLVALPEVPCAPVHFSIKMAEANLLGRGCVIVISEGAHIRNGDMDIPVALDPYGNELLYKRHLAKRLAIELGPETAVRALILGHLQCGAPPVYEDIELGQTYAAAALAYLEEERTLVVPAYFAGELRCQPMRVMAGQQREVPQKTIRGLVDAGLEVAGWEEE